MPLGAQRDRWTEAGQMSAPARRRPCAWQFQCVEAPVRYEGDVQDLSPIYAM
jgi:hypothetical protein